MSRVFRTLFGVLGLALFVQSATAFSLLGPQEPYTEQEALGYGDIFGQLPLWRNGVKNIDDDYRWNTKVVYYSYDPEFISYFGSNGIVAIDKAFNILNSLTNVSLYSSNLTEFPLEAKAVNYTASALGLLDLKSTTLELIIEHMGLADPDFFVWTLRNRALPPEAECPDYEYGVLQRNFDPITLAPSPYVNGNLFTYEISELCPDPSIASAEEVRVDLLSTFNSAVASGSTFVGEFWQGLTRDDIGGLRYLLSTNNLNWETTPADALIYYTNQVPTLLYSSNLQEFAQFALTNDAAALEDLYPGLVVLTTSNYFVNVVQTNVVAYFTNLYTDPIGTPPRLVYATNYTEFVETRYVHTFDNVVTNEFNPYCVYSILTTNIAPQPYQPVGSGISVTNVTFQTFVDPNCVSGSFYVLPTNACAYHVLYTQLTQVVTFTNFLTNSYTTNTITQTNIANTNAFDYYEFSQSIVTYFTNRIRVVWPVLCPDQVTSLFQGVERIQFVRRDYDSLLGQFFEPVITNFTLVEVTNNTRWTRPVERTVLSPDILFYADDLNTDPESLPVNFAVALTEPEFVTATNANNNGPGTITPTAIFTFNKAGPLLINNGPFFLTEATGIQSYQWGSFDGSTNAPVVFPNGTDLRSLENQAVLQITQPSVVTNGAYLLPLARLNQAYSNQLEAIGGQLPYSWSFAPGSAGLPTGLSLSNTGLISGTPLEVGIFDFSIRLTETGARYVDRPFTLTVDP
jgi:hypothetical protein